MWFFLPVGSTHSCSPSHLSLVPGRCLVLLQPWGGGLCLQMIAPGPTSPSQLLPGAVSSPGLSACIKLCVKGFHHTTLSICLHVTLGVLLPPMQILFLCCPFEFLAIPVPSGSLCHYLFHGLLWRPFAPWGLCFLEAVGFCFTYQASTEE